MRDEKYISFSRFSSALRDSVILEEALIVVKKLFSLFGKHPLEMFAGLLRNVLEEVGVDKGDTKVKLKFVRSGYVLEGFVISVENYDPEGWFIRELGVWLRKVQRVFVMSEFGPSRNLKNSFVLRDGRNEKYMKL